MANCPHYEIHRTNIKSKRIPISQQARSSKTYKKPGCISSDAKGQDIHIDYVSTSLGESPLKCDGDINKCMIENK